jgi:3-oxoadipate enol-lactonase
MPKIEVNGARLFFTLTGVEGAPVVVLSSSLGTTLDMWRPQLQPLEREYRLLRYDMRGHGSSELTLAPCTIATLAQDVVAMLDKLGLGKVHFCGLSIGGFIGQWLGARIPERVLSLLLCNTAAKIGTPETWNKRIADVEQGGMPSIAEPVLERWFTPAFRMASPAAVAPLRAMLLATDPRGYTLLCAAIRDMDHRELVEEIRIPTCVLAGAHDPVTTVEDATFLQTKIPGAKLVTLPAAHISNVEAAARFNDSIITFLQGIGHHG